MLAKTNHLIRMIKQRNPLILNITNFVTAELVANGLISVGASPIMSNALQEIAELMPIAEAVVINIGTLNDQFIELCHTTCEAANKLNKPIIFDPVGAGATKLRTKTSLDLLNKYNIAIVKGNAGEIFSLTESTIGTKGVDSLIPTEKAIESAQELANRYSLTVFVSGKTDIVTNGNTTEAFSYGSPQMKSITGTGCLLSAIIAAFHCVEHDRYQAAVAGGSFYNNCGEAAAFTSKTPGTFKVKFLDALASFNHD